MSSDIHYPTFIAAGVAVFLGSMARRASELDAMETIRTATLFRMFGIELMLMPAFASCAGFLVMYYDISWVFVIPIGVAAGLGGFATGTLIFELFKTVLTTLAARFGGPK